MKNKNKLKYLTLGILLTGAVGFSTLAVKQVQVKAESENVVNINRENKKLVSFDDSDYSVNFVKTDLVNDRWENLFNYFDDYGFTENENDNSFSMNLSSGYIEDKRMIYTDLTYSAESNIYQIIFSDTQEHYINWWSGMGYEGTPTFSPYKFYLVHNGQLEEWDNEELLSIVAEDTSDFPDLVSAVELDIQANESSYGESIITAISSGLGLIPDLAQEFLTGFTTLFWDSAQEKLTDFGTFALVFLGVAITMAVVKLCLAILRSNTGA